MHIDPVTPRLVRIELLGLFVREVARAAQLGDIDESARRLALALTRRLVDADAIPLDEVLVEVFGRAPPDVLEVDLAPALSELALAGLVAVRHDVSSRAALRIAEVTLLVPMRRARRVQQVSAKVGRAVDLLAPSEIAMLDDEAERVRARIATRRGRFVEMPQEVIGA
jgi:hypothetical protein